MSNAAAGGTFTLGDITVNRLGFGTMRLVDEGAWGEPPKGRAACHAVLRRAVELGVSFIDTADAYGPGIAEEIVAEALHPYPAGVLIATKGGLARMGPAKSKPLGRPEYLHQSVEMSLRRLRVDCIDLYQLHRIDPLVPMEETLGILAELQKAGKIRHIGLSEVNAEQIERAQKVVPIVSVQNKYNIGHRVHEATLDYCTKHGIGFIPWYPVGAGRMNNAQGPLAETAKQHGISITQLMLAWLLHRSPVMLPIPGTSTVPHLEENVAAAAVKLTDEEWATFELQMDTQAS